MVVVEKIDTRSRAEVQRFIHLPFRIYRNDPSWVPPLLVEHENQLNRARNPFFEHSDADFFVAVKDGCDVGRIAAIENRRFNHHHDTHKGQFYIFESENDPEVAQALFQRAIDWSRKRSLDTLIGPKGLGPLDGFGLLIDGFDKRQMMAMMNYNPPYYVQLIESLGFTKEVDFVSCYADKNSFHLPERIRRISERTEKRGALCVQSFNSVGALEQWAGRIGQAYNRAFIHNWEYYPLTDREIDAVVSSLKAIADPTLIKLILHNQEIVGFLFAFPDVAPALQRWHGRLLPFLLFDAWLEQRRTKWVAVNVAGVIPEFQGRGGNALLYGEMEKTLRRSHFEHCVLYQVAETAVDMRRDLENVGASVFKNHRVYALRI